MAPGDRVEVGLPQWLMREKGFLSREVEGEIVRATPKAIYVKAHALVRESEQCHRCGRDIDNPASRLLGYGIDCAAHLGLPHAETYAALSPEEREAIRNRVVTERVVECWLPLSQVVIRSHVSVPPVPVPEETPEESAARWRGASAVIDAMRAEAAPPPANPRRVEWADGFYRVVFPYDQDMVSAVKRVPGAKWNKTDKCWTFGPVAGADLLRFAAEHGFEVDAAALAQAEAARAAVEQNVEESRAAVADFQVDGLGGTLRPFQSAGTRYMARQRRVLLGDQMGLGKTVQLLATMQATDAFPALMVVPASLKLNWMREAKRWLPGRSVAVLEGSKSYAFDADVVVINYDILSRWVSAEVAPGQENARNPEMIVSGPLAEYGFRFLGCDESHMLKNHKAKRTVLVQHLAAHLRKESEAAGFEAVLVLASGTPLLNRPSELIAPLQIIDRLGDLGGWYSFATRYCGYANRVMGAAPVSASALEELNERMRAVCYVRRLKSDVLKELPPKVRSTLPMAINNRAEYRRAERDLLGWVAEQAAGDRAFNASLKGMSEDEKKKARRERAQDAAARAANAEQLVRLGSLKKLAARGKMDAAAEWVESFLESGEKLVLAAWHQEVVEELAQRFGAPYIHGGVSLEARDKAVTAFQRCARCGVLHDKHTGNADACPEYVPDMSCPLIVLNIRSGGVGLTLTAASNLGIVELGWTPGEMDQLEDRIHRIGQAESANIWYLLAEETIEEDIAALIDDKRLVVDAATEGEGRDESPSIMADLMKRMAARAG